MNLVTRMDEFKEAVTKPFTVQLSGEVFPFRVPEPSLVDVVAQAREQPQARIATGTRGDTLLESLQDYSEEFRRLPLEEAVHAPVHLTLFDLGPLAKPGGALHEVIEEVFRPLTQFWADHGLRWKRAWPILFLSGPGCSTNYHWDPDDVSFIMLSGHKRFYALNDPRRWVTPEMIKISQENAGDLRDRAKPSGLSDEDTRFFDMSPGDALWSPIHTAHWVDADDNPAFSLSIAFTDASLEPSQNRVMAVE